MKTRLITSMYITIALILMFSSRILNLYVFDVVMVGLLAIMGVVEIARTIERMKKPSEISFAGSYIAFVFFVLYVGITYNFAWWFYVLAFLAIITAILILSTAKSVVFKNKTSQEIEEMRYKKSKKVYVFEKALNSGLLFIYPTLLFGSIFFLNHFHELHFVKAATSVLTEVDASLLSLFGLLMAFGIAIATDSFAMIVGSIVKGKKIFPIISPKKTYSGAIGGLLGGIGASYLIYGLFSFSNEFAMLFNLMGNGWLVLLIGILGSVACQAGDLLASYLKRKARVKDYGTIFPGHGGVMDRVDGLISTSTVVFVIMTLFLMI